MQLHLARAESRLDADGQEIPLDRQDRKRWDAGRIALARSFLGLAAMAPPGASGRFVIEARIAEQHCLAPTFAETDWKAIVGLYDQLVEATGSPVAELHRAVAVGYAGAPALAIERVEQLREQEVLRRSHLVPAVLAHLSAMRGDEASARRYAEESGRLGGTAHEQRLMFDQVERLLTSPRQP
jgi:RNA polymerase sigma-70 factor (ECF subfamily)